MAKTRQLKTKETQEIINTGNRTSAWLGWRTQEKPSPVKTYSLPPKEINNLIKNKIK